MGDELTVGLITFIGGTYVRYLFDGRDYRRKLVEKKFIKFNEECGKIRDFFILELQELKNDEQIIKAWDYFESNKERVKCLGNDLVYALDVLSETEASKIVLGMTRSLQSMINRAMLYYNNRFDDSGKLNKDMVEVFNCALKEQEAIKISLLLLNRRMYFVLTSFFWWDISRLCKCCCHYVCNGCKNLG